MVIWVVDRGILKLFAQINAMAPDRRKGSDGTLGDPDHQTRTSDHNPETDPPPGNPDNQVDAGDYTHDPAHGADMGRISERIRVSRDRRVRYVIFSRRIFYGYDRPGLPAFTWTEYHGDDPHTGHMHVSVNDVHHDETQDWSIGMHPNDEKALINRVNTIIDMAPVNPYGDSLKPEPNKLAEAINAITAALAEFREKLRLDMEKVSADLVELKRQLAEIQVGPHPEYKGTATVILHVGDEVHEDIDRGGQ